MTNVKLKPRRIAGFGWKPDLPDHRDLISYTPTLRELPDSLSLRSLMPPVYNQMSLGSCTANAIASLVQYQQLRQNKLEGQNIPSRLFIYYGERELEGSIDYDAGAYLRDGMKVVANLGAPPESDWPYDIDKFTQRPPQKAYDDALKFQTLKYARVYRTSYFLRSHIAAGRPYVFGFTVFSNFWASAQHPPFVCSMPTRSDTMEGGHAVVVVGYKKDMSGQNLYEVRNSWDVDWGEYGHFWMPEAYLLDRGLSSDFWNILRVE